MEATFLIAGILLLAMLAFGRFLLGKAPEVSAKDSANSPDVKGPMSAIQLGVPEGLDDGIKFASMEAGYISMPGDM